MTNSRRTPVFGTRCRPRGFTFMEILIVMAVAAVLLGLGIGFLVNIGRASLAQQAAAICAESGQRCLNASAGGKRSILEFTRVDTEQGKRIEVRTAVERPVLTANFESTSPDTPLPDWFIFANEPTTAKPEGRVSLDLQGKSGS